MTATNDHRYAASKVGDIEVRVVSIKYRQTSDMKSVGKISRAIAEFKAAGFDIDAVTTAHANGLFRSFFVTMIVASRQA